MRIAVLLSFNERAAVRLLNHLAQENAIILREHPDLPLLYDSGVVYRREADETWCDFMTLLVQGHEDCDGLAAARAGELLARGHRALRSGDGGFEAARARRLAKIEAEVMLRTRTAPNEPGLYHCIVRYWVAGKEYRDDPSARLGMNGQIDPTVRRRWSALDIERATWRTDG